MSVYDDRMFRALKAVLELADANFPGSTDIKIEAVGTHHGAVTMPAYVLRQFLRARDE